MEMGTFQASISLRSSCISNVSAAHLKSVPSTCHIFSEGVTKRVDKWDVPKKLAFGDTALHGRSSSHRKLSFNAHALLTAPFSLAAKTPSKYVLITERGGQVKIYTEKKNNKYSVCIQVSSLQLGVAEDDELVLSWGIYRSDSSSFIPLKSDGHTQCSTRMITETPFRLVSPGTYEVNMEMASHLAPCYLSFVLKSPLTEIKSRRRRNFCVPVGFGRGYPNYLGPSFYSNGVINFAFFSKSVDSVSLCLYNDTTTEKPALEIELDPYANRTGDIWHASIDSASDYVSYAYRIKRATTNGIESKIILDPYAKVISKSILGIPGLAKLSRVPAFDWGGDMPPCLPMEELVVYHLNVMKFTNDESSKLPSKYAGTFAGVTEKVQHFNDLGVNAILLEPIFPFDERKGPYYPSHFFSPVDLYGPFGDYRSAIVSMKDMVKTMHANGIEVYLEVVFTHADKAMSVQESDQCSYPAVQQFIIDSLHYWVTEFHIDGFCFVDASYLSPPHLAEAIALDPILSKTKIVADFWDPHDSTLIDTGFPHCKRWAEVNKRFCSDVRNFLRGNALLSDLATRVCGSGDMFSGGRGPSFSFNFVSRNSGLPLVDLVSFSKDELASELSWNCGEEGPTDQKDILERRVKQIRNFLFILYISLGVPVLNMGDEAGQSCEGSVAYDDRKPFNWRALNTAFGMQTAHFVSFMCSLRKRRGDLLQMQNFLDEKSIKWYAKDLSPPRWNDRSAKFLAMSLKHEDQEDSRPLYVAFNASDNSETATLPLLPEGMRWARMVDTALSFPGFFSSDGEAVLEETPGLVTYEVKSHSCVLLEAQKLLGSS